MMLHCLLDVILNNKLHDIIETVISGQVTEAWYCVRFFFCFFSNFLCSHSALKPLTHFFFELFKFPPAKCLQRVKPCKMHIYMQEICRSHFYYLPVTHFFCYYTFRLQYLNLYCIIMLTNSLFKDISFAPFFSFLDTP